MPQLFHTLHASNKLARLCQKTSQSINSQMLVMEEFSSLRNLRQVITEHGISRALLAYADQNNSLRQIIPGLPAVESLNAVPLSLRDTRHLAALEGIDQALGQEDKVLASWVDNLSRDTADLFSSTLPLVEHAQSTTGEISAQLAEKTLDDVTLDTTIVTARMASSFAEIFTKLAAQVAEIGSVDVEALFTSA